MLLVAIVCRQLRAKLHLLLVYYVLRHVPRSLVLDLEQHRK